MVWRRAHVVVAPHGAALANVIFVQPGTLLVELGYYSVTGNGPSLTERVGMPWPAPYYWAAAASADSGLSTRGSDGKPRGRLTQKLKMAVSRGRARAARLLLLLLLLASGIARTPWSASPSRIAVWPKCGQTSHPAVASSG